MMKRKNRKSKIANEEASRRTSKYGVVVGRALRKSRTFGAHRTRLSVSAIQFLTLKS